MSLEGTLLGRNQLQRLIGSGGIGEVYLAEDTRLHRQVAIKVISVDKTLEASRRFEREMRLIATLDHPNISPVLDFGEAKLMDEAFVYVVMPYYQEGSLADWLQKRSSTDLLGPEDAAYVVSQAAGALQYAHEFGVIHGDIKPSNLLIRSTGSDPNRPDVQVADFGLRDFTAWAVTKTSRGKAAYATPEELESQLTAASDQYALATVTYKILTGRTPFTDSPEQVINQIMGQQPPPPSTFNPRISPALDAVILRALAKRPWGRFASISEFATAFQRASSSKEVTRPPEVLYQPSSAPPPFAPANPYGSPGFLPSYPPVDPYPPPPPPLPVQGAQSGLSDVFKSVGNTVKKIFSGGRKQKTKETSPSLFAIARVGLEKDDRAAVGRQYTVQAGIAQNKPADFAGEPFTLPNWNPAEPVWFDILLHASDNIEVLREWHTRLRYDGRNPEPQLVTFWFRFITAGHGTLALNFYHERRWLKVIRFEVETIEQAESTTSSVGGWYGA